MRRNSGVVGVVACIAAVMCHTSVANATGTLLGSKGARNQAMGGVGIAQTRDILSWDHNPALLARHEGTDAYINYHGFYMKSTMERLPDEDGSYEPTENIANEFNHIPNFVIGSDFGLEDAYFATGLMTPIGPRHNYDPYGPQRYGLVNALQVVGFWGFAGAYDAADWIDVGGTLMIGMVSVMQERRIPVAPERASLDGTMVFEGSGFPLITGQAGVTLKPFAGDEDLDGLSVGLSYHHRINLVIEGDVNIDMPKFGIKGSDVAHVETPLAEEFRLGFAYEASHWTAEAAVKYARWSIVKEQVMNLENNNIGGNQVDDLVIKKNNSDGIGIHVGGEYNITEMHAVRAGYFHETEVVGSSSVSVTEFDAARHGISIGYGLTWDNWTIDFSALHVFSPPRTITDSGEEAIVALGDPKVVGNMKMDWDVEIIGLGVGYAFD